MRSLHKNSPCKVNLLLNILGKRPDGFHELETVFHPVNLCDRLSFEHTASTLTLTCSNPDLPTDSTNLVHRAARAFLDTAKIQDGVKIHLEKRIPMAAGLGGGSGNAAVTLLGLNELFGSPLSLGQLHTLAATLGSDVNFFLQSRPALATGRGEKVESLDDFAAMKGATFLLIHPGFGISTAWAYKTLANYPPALNGKPGRARRLVKTMQTENLSAAGKEFYNSLEAPALDKYPILALYQDFLLKKGAAACLMSGSGSTTFALFQAGADVDAVAAIFKERFGATCWTAVVPV